MKKSKLIPYEKEHLFYPRSIAIGTAKDFSIFFDNNSRNGEMPLTGLALITTFNLTEMEVEEGANISPENRRTVEIDIQKCRVSIELSALRNNNKLAGEYFQLEYGNEMSLAEKIEES